MSEHTEKDMHEILKKESTIVSQKLLDFIEEKKLDPSFYSPFLFSIFLGSFPPTIFNSEDKDLKHEYLIEARTLINRVINRMIEEIK